MGLIRLPHSSKTPNLSTFRVGRLPAWVLQFLRQLKVEMRAARTPIAKNRLELHHLLSADSIPLIKSVAVRVWILCSTPHLKQEMYAVLALAPEVKTCM